jgi:hypothetical protein
MRRKSTISDKLNISLIYSQMEIGLLSQFLSESFQTYGHLSTITFLVQIWKETEPFGLTLRPAPNATWIPPPLFSGNKAIIDLATKAYNTRGSLMINRCRIYLQIISIGDLLLFNLNSIHPSYIEGVIPPSRKSLLLWLDVGRPPKHYWQLWSAFLQSHIIPFITNLHIHWPANPPFRLTPIHFKHSQSRHLYRWEDSAITRFPMSASSRSNGSATYSNIPYMCDITFSPSQFCPVDTHYTTQGIRIVGSFNRCHLSSVDTNIPTSLQEAFQALPASLQHICGSIRFPPDDGKNIIDNTHDSMTLFGASDAALRDSKGSHAWIISTGLSSDITDETRHITGSGPVDGFIQNQSSSRGELQGITAVSIFSQLLLHFHKVTHKIDIICDNQGMVNRCANIHFTSLVPIECQTQTYFSPKS